MLCRFLITALAVIPQAGLAGTVFLQANLVSDIPGLAAVTDPNLKNPWGMSFSPTSPFWISDQGTGRATLYNGLGVPQPQPTPLIVTIPPTAPGSGPTGQVFNSTSGFVEPNGSPATFIFATTAGTLDAWNNANGTTATVVATQPASAYTGLTPGAAAVGNVLYAANFRAARIDVFSSSFLPVTLAGSFTDPTLPAGFAPYNVENVSGTLYVTYAKVNPANGRAMEDAGGFVSVFDVNGNFVKRLVSNGPLNAPWGIALAPLTFGDFSGALLVGNFAHGDINAFNPNTGAFLGTLTDASGKPIENDGLWALRFRTGGAGVNTNALYFTAGINSEADGLFGSIQPVPEPGTFLLAAFGLCGAILYRTRR